MNVITGYPIRYVAMACGLKPHVIRTWERRYQAIVPERTETNRRVYSEEDIRRLRLLKAAVEAGHSISQVAGLETEALSGVVDHTLLHASEQAPERKGLTDEIPVMIQEALDAVIELDSRRLERVLERAAVNFTRPVLLQDLIVPLFQQIGELWKAGKIKIIGEHMAVIVTRTLLWDILRTTDISDSAPRILFATPSGHWHERGVIVAALVAAEAGWLPLYFGPNLPAEEIAAAVAQTGARALALGVAHRIDDNVLATELKKVRRYSGSHMPIFVGGMGADHILPTLESIGAKRISGLADFRNDLERLTVSE